MTNPTDKLKPVKELVAKYAGKPIEAPAPLAKAEPLSEAHMLAKAHVDAFTRKDGAFVKEHDTKVQAAPEQSPAKYKTAVRGDDVHHPGLNRRGMVMSSENGKYNVTTSKGKEQWSHDEVHGNVKPAKEAPQAKEAAPAAKPADKKPTGIAAHADAFKGFASTFENDDDRGAFENAHEAMASGDHAGLKRAVGRADTYQREQILDHVHPDHWDSLGASPIDKDKALANHERRFGKSAPEKKESIHKNVMSDNKDFGFYGESISSSLRQQLGHDHEYDAARKEHYEVAHEHAAKKFSDAANHLVKEGHFDAHHKARDYLDSKDGRHLHDAIGDTSNGEDVSKVKWLDKSVKKFKDGTR